MSVLSATRSALITSTEVVELIAKDPVGAPAVYRGQYAPEAAVRPYVLLDLRAGISNQQFMRAGTLLIDIYTNGPLTHTSEAIRDAISARLEVALVADASSGDIYRFSESTIDTAGPTEDPKIARWHLEIPARFWRGAFLEARGA